MLCRISGVRSLCHIQYTHWEDEAAQLRNTDPLLYSNSDTLGRMTVSKAM